MTECVPLVVASEQTRSVTRAFVDAIAESYGHELPLIDDEDASLDLLSSGHIILFGGSHKSRFAMELALRYQTCSVDATVPGDDGWAVTTHVGLGSCSHCVTQISTSESTTQDTLEYVIESLQADGNSLEMPILHHMSMGSEMLTHFPGWEEFGIQFLGKEDNPKELLADIHGLAALIGKGLDSGGSDRLILRHSCCPVSTLVTNMP